MTLELVPLAPGHLGQTLAWANDPELSRLLNRAGRIAPADHEAWFARLAGRQDCAYFAVEEHAGSAARHVGNVWLWEIDDRHRKAELRIVIGEPQARGRGVGCQAIDLLCRHGFEQRQLHRIYAFTLGFNRAARRAFEKAGFVLEGTLRDDRWTGDRFCDVDLLARLNPALEA